MATANIVASGFIQERGGLIGELWNDVNGTYLAEDSEFELPCGLFHDLVEIGTNLTSNFRRYEIRFTKKETITFKHVIGGISGAAINELTTTFPEGVKAIITVNTYHVIGAQQDNIFSFAIFHKVIPDTDGYVDCSASVSGFTLNAEEHSVSSPCFDASSASVSYA